MTDTKNYDRYADGNELTENDEKFKNGMDVLREELGNLGLEVEDMSDEELQNSLWNIHKALLDTGFASDLIADVLSQDIYE